MLAKETKEGLIDFGVNPDTVDWILTNDYMNASLEEVNELYTHYKVITFASSDKDKMFIVPRVSWETVVQGY